MTKPEGIRTARDDAERLLGLGRAGGCIFAPAHDVEGDVRPENMLAFIEVLQARPRYRHGGE